jgi:phosphatidylserine decarboxylase
VFAREGYTLIAAAAVFGLGLAILAWRLDLSMAWRAPLWGLAVGLVAFTLYFFRDPMRTPPAEAAGGRLVLAPADGKVVEMVDEEEPTYLQGPARRLSIFLSPLDVHVNRIPADGVVTFTRYVPGDYLVAWHPKASEKNERSEIGVEHPSGLKVFFKQIAGAVARRIEFHVDEGDTVRAGERFGIVKFGSRMDVIVPPSVAFAVEVGDRVRAGETVLGRFPASTSAEMPVAAADSSEG